MARFGRSVTGLFRQRVLRRFECGASPEGHNLSGYPVLLHLRRVIEDAVDFDGALKQLTSTTLATSGLITLVGERNDQRVVIERTPTKHALRWPSKDDAPLITTNDYRLLYEPATNDKSEIYQSTCSRFEKLASLLKDCDPTADIPDTQLLYYLTDPNIQQAITAQHILIRPRQREIKLFTPQLSSF